jgi:Uma2 family endonuclease
MAAVLDRPATVTFSLSHYHHLIALGLLADHRVELLEGEIVRMAPMSAPHIATVQTLRDLIPPLLPPTLRVFDQSTLVLAASAPEPDLMILNAIPSRYTDRKPTASDVSLVIEVSYTTLDTDQGRKLAIYAESGIPEYWVVDLENTVIHHYSDPQPTTRTYGSQKTLKPGDTITSMIVPSVSLAVKDILGV